MANKNLKSDFNLQNQIINIKEKSLFARLKKLFSAETIVRNIGGKKIKVVDTDDIMYATEKNSYSDTFNRVRSTSFGGNSYSRDFALSYHAARLDLFRDYDCVGPDTVIPLPDGSRPTISELAEKYKNNPQERFYVFSYDHKTDSIKLGKAYHPRKKSGVRQGYKVTFDNGQSIIGSLKHPFLMRDGTKKRLFELRVGDSVMPFYEKECGYNKHGSNGYRKIYNFSKGWQPEHKIINEQFYRPFVKNEVVHHKNFKESKKINDVTFDNIKEKAVEYYKEYSKINLLDFIKHIHCNNSTLQNRLRGEGHNWKSFKRNVESTLNHKIVSIEPVGEVEVYDVTVEKYANFATDSCIVGNTMDMDPIISSALDIFADESLTPNEFGKIITIKSDDDNIRDTLDNLFNDILNIKFNLWSWTRNACKYGDFYLKIHISPKYGVYLVEPLSAYNVERIENTDPRNKNYTKFQVRATNTTQNETLESFEIAHFRLLSDTNFLPYGKSIIEAARRIWKQVSLMEDAMLISRIMRAPEKRIFQIDVGNIPPNEVEQFMSKVIGQMKKVPYMDEKTGDYNLRFNLQNMTEDFFLPVRGGDSGTKIDTLPGMEFTGIEDIEYLRNKMMAALKIPKAFLGYEEGLSGKASLASEDIRFTRTINRVQNTILSELAKIAYVHLYAQGFRDKSLVNFQLELTNPSTIFEKEKIALWADKIDSAINALESKLLSRKWVYKNMFKFTEDDIETMLSEIVEDTKQSWRYKSIEEEGNDPTKPYNKINPNDGGGSSGGGPGELPGLEGGPESPGLGEKELPIPSGGPEPVKEGSSVAESEGMDRRMRNRHRPSQAGEKSSWMRKSDNTTFGEDPLGHKEIVSTPRDPSVLSRIKYESLMQNDYIKNLVQFIDSSVDKMDKEILQESTKSLPMLDERNIIDE